MKWKCRAARRQFDALLLDAREGAGGGSRARPCGLPQRDASSRAREGGGGDDGDHAVGQTRRSVAQARRRGDFATTMRSAITRRFVAREGGGDADGDHAVGQTRRLVARAQAHLETCHACSDAFAALQKVEGLLARVRASAASAAPIAPPANLARRIMERVQRVEEARAARGSFSWLRAPAFAVSACALLLAAVTFTLWQNTPGGEHDTQLTQTTHTGDAQTRDNARIERTQTARAQQETAQGVRASGERAQLANVQDARAQQETASGVPANGERTQLARAQTGSARDVRAQGVVARGEVSLRAQDLFAQAAREQAALGVAPVAGVPGVVKLEQLSGAELAALTAALAGQRLGASARAVPPDFFARRDARGRVANVAERAVPSAGWPQRGGGGAREAVARAPRLATDAPTHREYCALALGEPACNTWKALMLGLAARNADAFVAEADAVPAASRTRWLSELARSATPPRETRANIAAYLHTHPNERARKLATHFE